MSTTVRQDETFAFRLPVQAAAELRAIAESEGNGASAVIRRLLMRALQMERRAERQHVGGVDGR